MRKYIVSAITAVCALFNLPLIANEVDHKNPEYLYKIISLEQWEQSLIQKEIVLAPSDQDFIHFATEDQLNYVAQTFWKNKDYVVLKLVTEKLVGRLVYETNPGGSTKYYHLYEGNISLDAVLQIDVTCTSNQREVL